MTDIHDVDEYTINVVTDFFMKNSEKLLNSLVKGVLEVDLTELDKYDPALFNLLFENIEVGLTIFNHAFDKLKKEEAVFEDKEYNEISFKNVPQRFNITLKDINSKSLNKFCCIEIFLSNKSEIKPQITNSLFECPVCGTQIEKIHTNMVFEEPTMCPCGRKGKFKCLSTEYTDAMNITVSDTLNVKPLSKKIHVIGYGLVLRFFDLEPGSIISLMGYPTVNGEKGRLYYDFKILDFKVIKEADKVQIEFVKNEIDLMNFLAAHSHYIEEGLMFIDKDTSEYTDRRRIDLLFRDKLGNVLIVELKIHGDSATVNQLTDYVRLFVKKNPNQDCTKIRKMIACITADSNLKKSCEAMNIEFLDLGVKFKKTCGEEVLVRMAIFNKVYDAYDPKYAEVIKSKKELGLSDESEAITDSGELDIDRIVTGITSAQRNRIIIMRELIKELESKYGSNIALADLINAAKEKEIEESKVKEIIEKMKRDGELFEPKQGLVRRFPKL